MKVKSLFLDAVKSRIFVGISILILIQTIFLIILVSLNIRVTSVQIPVQYSAFNPTLYSREQWFYLFNFTLFAVMAFIINLFISLKILDIKGRSLALSFLWLTAAVMFIAIIITAALLRVAGIE